MTRNKKKFGPVFIHCDLLAAHPFPEPVLAAPLLGNAETGSFPWTQSYFCSDFFTNKNPCMYSFLLTRKSPLRCELMSARSYSVTLLANLLFPITESSLIMWARTARCFITFARLANLQGKNDWAMNSPAAFCNGPASRAKGAGVCNDWGQPPSPHYLSDVEEEKFK